MSVCDQFWVDVTHMLKSGWVYTWMEVQEKRRNRVDRYCAVITPKSSQLVSNM